MKITKSYLKQIIKEELSMLKEILGYSDAGLSSAADKQLDDETAEEFGVTRTDKPTIDGLQDTVLKLKNLRANTNTTDNDMNIVVDRTPQKIKDLIRKQLGSRITRDTVSKLR